MSFHATSVVPTLPESTPVADSASVASSVKVSRPQDPLTAQILRVEAELDGLKKLAKLVGKTVVAKPKKDPSAPKGETPAQLKVWNTLVDSVLEELRTVDPKATRAQAMTEARKRQDATDPEGAAKREAARLKRQETAARKKAEKDGLLSALAGGASITEALADAAPAKERAKRAPMSEEAKAKAAEKRKATIAAKKAVGGGAGAPAPAATTVAAPSASASALKAKLAAKKAAPAVVRTRETLPEGVEAEEYEHIGVQYLKAADYLWELLEDGEQGEYVGKLVGGTIDTLWPEPTCA
jgi:hypothetical protein